MKKLLMALVLAASMTQAFATASFLAALGGAHVALGGMHTSITVAIAASPLAGLIVFADNGDAFIDIESKEAMDAFLLAIDKTVHGEKLTDAEVSLIEIYAHAYDLTFKEMVDMGITEL